MSTGVGETNAKTALVWQLKKGGLGETNLRCCAPRASKLPARARLLYDRLLHDVQLPQRPVAMDGTASEVALWATNTAPDGKVYYYHKVTNVTQWTKPEALWNAADVSKSSR